MEIVLVETVLVGDPLYKEFVYEFMNSLNSKLLKCNTFNVCHGQPSGSVGKEWNEDRQTLKNQAYF